MQSRLYASANATQTVCQSLRIILETLPTQYRAFVCWQRVLAGKQWQVLPIVHKCFDPLALNAVCQGHIADAALFSFGWIGYARRGAFQDQGTKVAGEGAVEGNASAHRVTQQNSFPRWNVQLLQDAYDIRLAMLHSIAKWVCGRVRLTMTQHINGDDVETSNCQLIQQRSPAVGAPRKAMQQH